MAVATLRAAITAGVSYIDTSPGYRGGDSDRRAGLALQDGWRDKVTLATKVGSHPDRLGDFSGATARWIVGQSLEILQTDRIDVVLLHDTHEMAPVMESDAAVPALESLKSDGTIGAIGIGVQNHGHLRTAIESGRFDVIQSPYDYNLMRTTSEPLMELAAERDLGFINASPSSEGCWQASTPTRS